MFESECWKLLLTCSKKKLFTLLPESKFTIFLGGKLQQFFFQGKIAFGYAKRKNSNNESKTTILFTESLFSKISESLFSYAK